MKNLKIVLGLIFVFGIILYQPSTMKAQMQNPVLVFERQMHWAASGVDTVKGAAFDTHCDTLAFVAEVLNYAWTSWNDSTRRAVQALYATTDTIDQISLIGKGAFLSSSGLQDTNVIGGMTTLISKGVNEGPVAFGLPLNSLTYTKKNGNAIIYLIATNNRAIAVDAVIRIWAYKKFINLVR